MADAFAQHDLDHQCEAGNHHQRLHCGAHFPPAATGLRIELGDGNDWIRCVDFRRFSDMPVAIYGGNGNDTIDMTLADVLALDIFGGDGNDTITVQRTFASRRVRLFGEGGRDIIGVSGLSTPRGLDVVDGAQASRVTVRDLHLPELTIRTSNRDDIIEVLRSNISGRVFIRAYGGDDRLVSLDITYAIEPRFALDEGTNDLRWERSRQFIFDDGAPRAGGRP